MDADDLKHRSMKIFKYAARAVLAIFILAGISLMILLPISAGGDVYGGWWPSAKVYLLIAGGGLAFIGLVLLCMKIGFDL